MQDTAGNARMYDMVTDQVLALLDKGVAPRRRPWNARSEAPLRASGTPYRGVNVFILLAQGRRERLWLTMRQINEWGGRVRKGERCTWVYFWKRLQVTDTDPETGDERPKVIPLLRSYKVWNLEQTDGVRVPQLVAEACRPVVASDPIAEAIWNGYADRPSLAHGGFRAYYDIASDHVQMPLRDWFDDRAEYESTRFHEAGHSTGHRSRLNRTFGRKFGDDDYGREELIAEMTAAFLCGETGLGVTGKRIENSAAYLQSWIRVLKADKAAVIVAAGAAQRAADYVLGRAVQDAGVGQDAGVAEAEEAAA